MRYASVCDGIGCASLAWRPIGWECSWVSEIDPFACAVVKHRFPDHENVGDMLSIDERILDRGAIDILVGGTPCQSFSVAGLRNGLADPRGNLAIRYCQLLGVLQPAWFVWENVPGVLSSGSGRDFGSILGAMDELGYGFAWRVLDAQFFGVPQRRRRVFVVGYRGDWRPAAAVLFESDSLPGNPAKSKKTRQEIAGALTTRTGDSLSEDNTYISGAVTSKWAKGSGGYSGDECQNLITAYRVAGDGAVYDEGNRTAPLTTGTDRQANIIAAYQCHGSSVGPMGTPRTGNGVGSGVPFAAGTLGTNHGNIKAEHAWTGQLTQERSGVRRLTPRECERLQGFPDDWTLVPYRGKPAADGPRYKAIGNSMAEPVMRWIGKRIQMVSEILRSLTT